MKLHAFYHVYQTDGWEDMYMEQIHSLCISGLANELSSLTIGVVGDKPLPYLPTKNTNVVFHSGNSEETDTLVLLREFAEKSPDCAILYFHTKGISQKDLFSNVSCWRRYMEYFVIFEWKLCVEQGLTLADAVGVNFDIHTCFGLKPHFSGGMWWARSSYINKLDHSFLLTDFRFDREFWIGSAITQGKPVTLMELHNSGLNNLAGAKHYVQVYSPCEYVGKRINPKLLCYNQTKM